MVAGGITAHLLDHLDARNLAASGSVQARITFNCCGVRRLPAHHFSRTPAAARPRHQTHRSVSGRTGDPSDGSGTGRLSGRAQKTWTSLSHHCPAPTAADRPRISAPARALGGVGSGPLWPLRSGSARTHGPAPHRSRLLPARIERNS